MKVSVFFTKKKFLAALPATAAAFGFGIWLRLPLFLCAISALAMLTGSAVGLRASGHGARLLLPLAAVAEAALTVLLIQIANETIRLVPVWKLALGVICVLLPMLVFAVFEAIFPHGDGRAAIILGSAVPLAFGIINAITYYARGNGISPADITALRTAADVVGNYELRFTGWMLIAVSAWAGGVFLIAGLHITPSPRRGHLALGTGLAAVLLAFTLHFALKPIRPLSWGREGVVNNGFVLNFCIQLNELLPSRPAGYSLEAVHREEARVGETLPAPETMPTVIVVMNEAFSDLSVYGELETDIPVTPFLDSLREDTVRGYALVSVYGGTTPNSEYEFLTGNSMAFFGAFEIPFMQRIHAPCYSLARYMNSLGYTSSAAHPMPGSNWRRSSVYSFLGFEKSLFEEDYPAGPTRAGYPLDTLVYDELLCELDKQDGPGFHFAVTVQNHGPYTLGGDFEERVTLLNAVSAEANEYLTCVHESDRAFGRFVQELQSREEPVIVLMYGDHHPKEEQSLIRALHGSGLETLDEQELSYMVPYIIWANFDIDEQGPALTSLNYLSVLLLERAGLPQPPYNRFLQQVQESIPAMNAFGYYSTTENRFLTTDQAKGEEKALLDVYEILVYNAVFDRENRSEVFFPLYN